MWIGSAKNNVSIPLGFESYKEPINSVGINLSYKLNLVQEKNFCGKTKMIK